MTALTMESFSYVSDLVRRESAIVLEAGKEYLVESRLGPVSRSAGLGDVNELVATLRSRPNATLAKAVVEALTTNETSFFRDAEPFNALRTTVLPELARTRPTRSIRVWSAACSSGQESYSIAMTIRDTPEVAGFRTEIVGTDLSEEMVERSRAGRYSQLEVNRGLPATTLVKNFTRAGAHWQIAPDLAAMTSFRTLNLMRPFVGLGRLDIVFVRNVLIYFDVPTKADILRRIRQTMAPDGFLFLGAAETPMGVDDGWERMSVGRQAIYRPAR
ncbi:protein-glutamate O-methyltransferase CheR [Nocardioides mangrovicus]|uniref:protein-glutamate O-methyltransferase n=1 Tax=Nocardioides mangrovicus TaxID=2478913 RepID=A0A3L8P2Z0_9ACTN|nr:protein-glutamate O-methyltransferase CheR [Nocardioides mangrovicus]RLV48798.1 protein-glutamate O-methyltransferase CheR [Nocardioides mangrovicus]